MSRPIADLLAEAPAARACREALGDSAGVWIVGGAVRDAALGRPVTDLDLAVSGDPREFAKAIARRVGGKTFQLSEEFATWRAIAPDDAWQVDVAALRAEGIEGDLGLRDFTVNAVATPLWPADATPIDPLGGLADLDAGLLRVASERSFSDDPLRLVRAARIATDVQLDPDPATIELARSQADSVGQAAGERQLAELRLLLGGGDPIRGLALLDQLGVSATMLPELEALRGVAQNPYHHLDVHGHTLEVLERLIALQGDLESVVGESADQLAELFAEPLADDFTRGGALRFAALLHDVGKPDTRTLGEGEGAVHRS